MGEEVQLFHPKQMDGMRELMISRVVSPNPNPFISYIPYPADVNSGSDLFHSALFDGKCSEHFQ